MKIVQFSDNNIQGWRKTVSEVSKQEGADAKGRSWSENIIRKCQLFYLNLIIYNCRNRGLEELNK